MASEQSAVCYLEAKHLRAGVRVFSPIFPSYLPEKVTCSTWYNSKMVEALIIQYGKNQQGSQPAYYMTVQSKHSANPHWTSISNKSFFVLLITEDSGLVNYYGII